MISIPEFNDLVARTMTEKVWQAHVEQLAKALGYLIYHTHDSRRSQAGFPDLVMVKDHRMIFAELKRQKGRIRPEQRVWLDAISRVTLVEQHLWRPGDRDDVIQVLRGE